MTAHALDADLHFAQGEVQGFSTLATTHWVANPEPVVRELLQNCLDAAHEADRETADVWFSIEEAPLRCVPGIDSYRRHFDQAVAEREEGKQSASEKQVISRITRVLENGAAGTTVSVLFCRDNGIGLDDEGIGRLLTEGNTAKDEAGAGAFGVGHLTAFAASDLRYVLYAGRARDHVGNLRDAASGHAVLASYKKDKRGGHGYWLRREDRNSVPDLFDPKYPNCAPLLLARELDRLDDTGAVVCVTGFNHFRADESDSVSAIARVAAKNFLVAIWQGKMTVTIRREDDKTIVDRDTLGAILEEGRHGKRAEQKGGWLAGAQAHQAWETLQNGERLALTSGAEAYVLPLKSQHARPKSRVQVFRNGMWITNDADELEPRRFGASKPFAAVIVVESGELARLVRGAEGPEHRGLHRRRLVSEDNKKLLAALRQIADELRSKAGKDEEAKEDTPDDFAMWGDGNRGAERVGKYRPRGGTGRKRATSMKKEAGNEESTDPRHRKGKKRKEKKGGAAPKAGQGVAGRMSWRAVLSPTGDVREMRVAWQPRGNLSEKDRLGVRVRMPSGSDETCEAPLPPAWLRITEVRHSEGVVYPAEDGFEAELPISCRDFTIVLADPAADANAMDIDLVRRRPTDSSADTRPGVAVVASDD